MRLRRSLAFATLVALAAPAVSASMTSGPSSPPSQPAQSPTSSANAEGGDRTGRQQAEQEYGLAYEEIGKAKKDLEDGKTKNAEKKFRHALEWCERAVELDERYHEAWNLVGFAARKLGDYDKAFKAYDRCLSLKPDYAPAREYLGEAWLEKGDAKKAREQLVWLEHLGATEETKALKTELDAWLVVHPDSTAAPRPELPARADSSAAGSGSGR